MILPIFDALFIKISDCHLSLITHHLSLIAYHLSLITSRVLRRVALNISVRWKFGNVARHFAIVAIVTKLHFFCLGFAVFFLLSLVLTFSVVSLRFVSLVPLIFPEKSQK